MKGTDSPSAGVSTGEPPLGCSMRNLLLALAAASLLTPAWAADAPPAAAPAETASRPVISATAPPGLTAALAGLPTMQVFSRSEISLEVVNAATGEPVYRFGDDRPLLPASTMKLVTSAVALRELGPAYRFPTWIKYDGELGADGVLAGNLYVIGQGDPTMVVERMWKMVADIKARGVSEIQGDVRFDDTYMAGEGTWVPGWNKAEDLERGEVYYSALGALSLNYNVASIVVRPGATVGGAAVAAFDTPSDVLVLDNQLTTGRARSKYWVKVERKLDDAGKVGTYTLTGNVPVDLDADHPPIYRTLADPSGNYVSVFRDLARAHGIKVKGKFKLAPNAPESKLLLKVESDRLADILTDMNKQSNNFIAEQVLRTVAAERAGLPGTTEKGARLLGDYLSSLGVPAEQYAFVNGSGLSRDIRIAPSALDAVLVDMHGNLDLGPEYRSTLAVGGRDGTLWHRFRDDGMEGRVRAKTGSLSGVFCLAGYVTGSDGTEYAFTFLVNELEGSTARARAAHDQLVRVLSGVTGTLAEAEHGEGD
jgi:serine-type D-Ala-D-Ala carboxypeptidase/endopeptidase (penicillin-binding protein 4)